MSPAAVPAASQADASVAIVRRLMQEGFSEGSLDVIGELISPDCTEHRRGNGPGVAGAKRVVAALHSWFPASAWRSKTWSRTATPYGSATARPGPVPAASRDSSPPASRSTSRCPASSVSRTGGPPGTGASRTSWGWRCSLACSARLASRGTDTDGCAAQATSGQKWDITRT